MSETQLGNLTVVSPSIPHLTSISSASFNRMNGSLTSSVSLTQCTPQENNITENRLQMMERNTSSLGETLNRFIEAQRTPLEQVRNEGRYSTRQSENQSISSQVREAGSNVKDQGVDEETLDIFSEINSNNLVSTNTGPAISGQLAEVAKRYWEEESWKSLVVNKIAERLLIPNNCEFVRGGSPKPKIPSISQKG